MHSACVLIQQAVLDLGQVVGFSRLGTTDDTECLVQVQHEHHIV